MRSTASRPRLRSDRRIALATPARPSPPQPRSTTSCGFFSPVWDAPIARSVAGSSAKMPSTRWPRAFSHFRSARAGTCSSPSAAAVRRKSTRSSRNVYPSCAAKASTASTKPARSSNSRRPSRCSTSTSANRSTPWSIASRSAPICTSASSTPSRPAIANPARPCSSRPTSRHRNKKRPSNSGSASASSAASATSNTCRPSPGSSASIVRTGPARAARASATRSISTTT